MLQVELSCLPACFPLCTMIKLLQQDNTIAPFPLDRETISSFSVSVLEGAIRKIIRVTDSPSTYTFSEVRVERISTDSLTAVARDHRLHCFWSKTDPRNMKRRLAVKCDNQKVQHPSECFSLLRSYSEKLSEKLQPLSKNIESGDCPEKASTARTVCHLLPVLCGHGSSTPRPASRSISHRRIPDLPTPDPVSSYTNGDLSIGLSSIRVRYLYEMGREMIGTWKSKTRTSTQFCSKHIILLILYLLTFTNIRVGSCHEGRGRNHISLPDFESRGR